MARVEEPVISSFPGIWKFPSGRSDPFRSPSHWIEAKKFDDNIGNFWRIHDKLYDLEDFISRHPGGSDWISMTRGTDITEAFESSHFVHLNKIETILAKFYVSEAPHPRISPYTFEKNGFYKILKRRVEPILKGVGTGPTKCAVLIQDFLALTSVAISFLGVWLNSTALLVCAGIALGLNLLSAHNFLHTKENWRKFYFDMSMLSSHEFRISHVLSHHMYPNTIMDFDVAMMEPFLEVFPKSTKNWMQRHGSKAYIHVLLLFNFLIELLKRIFWVTVGGQSARKENLIVFAQLFAFCWISESFYTGFQSWMLIHCTASYWFSFTGLNAAHYHPDIFAEGDGARPDPDYGLCQLDAVREAEHKEHDDIFTILTSFGEHSLHHLFPTVDHSKLHHVKPIFDDTLREFCEEFPPLSKWEWITGLGQQLARTEPKPRPMPRSRSKHQNSEEYNIKFSPDKNVNVTIPRRDSFADWIESERESGIRESSKG